MEQNEPTPPSVTVRRLVARRVVSSLPLLLSILALSVSFLSYRLTAVRNVKPALIASYSGDSGWHRRNIGSGPALNVVVVQRRESGDWFDPVRVPPLAAGDQLHLFWMEHTNVRWIGAAYTDIDGRPYSSECADDLTRIRAGHAFPVWSEGQIGKMWQREAAKP
jgi:hypothetical protein